MRKALLPIALSLVLVPAAFAQAPDDAAARRQFRRGNHFYHKYEFLRAVPFYTESVNLDPGCALSSYRLGRSYFDAGMEKEALPYLLRAESLDRNVHEKDRLMRKDPHTLDYYLSRALHLHGRFEEAARHYQAELSRLNPSDPMYAETQMRIQQCENAPSVMRNKSPWDVKNMGEFVNTRFPEYAATFSEGYSYMVFTSRRPRNTEQRASNYAYAEDINEEVYEARMEGDTWMKARLFSKPIPVSRHDASIALSEDGKTLIFYEDKNYGDIFISRKMGEKWSKRESIGSRINTASNEPSAYIYNEGRTLIYVSDKVGGKGKKDLYISQLQGDGSWGEGVNMGALLNSEYDEDAPFVSADGKYLYFSSRGHNSMGGYDIFRSQMMPDGNWGEPKNLGFPVNSAAEDIYYLESPDGSRFFFSSNRPGGYGGMDLYESGPATVPAETQTIVSGVVTDEKTGAPLGAQVSLVDNATQEVVGTVTTVAGDGRYQFTIPQCGTDYRLDVKVAGASPATASVTGQPSSETLGNVVLISGNALDAVTREPLAAKAELLDPVSGRVLETVKTNPQTGNYFFTIPSGKKYKLRVSSDRYMTYNEDFSVDPAGKTESHNVENPLQPINPGNVFVITWQFFDVNKSELKTNYHEDLENLARVMNATPQLKLKIVGHTDSDASDEYNQTLSEARAAAVKKYLTDRGVDPSRLQTTGKGEKEPMYDNSGPRKSWNRRVELYVLD